MSPPRPPPPSPRRWDEPRRWVCSVLLSGWGWGGKGGSPPGQGGSPREGPRSPLATATSHPSSRGFSSLPPSGCGCGGDTRIPPPPTAHPTTTLTPPITPAPSHPGAGPAVEAVRSSFFFYRDVSSRRAPCARERPPPRAGLPSPSPPNPPPGSRGRPLPALPTVPHPTGQVLSLLEIKVHSLWCRGAAAAASCFVSGVRPGVKGAVAVTHWGPRACLPPPCSVCAPAGSCWPGLSPRPRAALQMSVLSREPRAVNYMVINL